MPHNKHQLFFTAPTGLSGQTAGVIILQQHQDRSQSWSWRGVGVGVGVRLDLGGRKEIAGKN